MSMLRIKTTVAVDFRAVLIARLRKINRTVNWLAERQEAVHPNSVREFLYGYSRRGKERDPKASTLAELLRIVGLRLVVVPKYRAEDFD